MTTTENMYTTMSIASLGPATLSDNKGYVSKLRAVRSDRDINDVSDIEGATYQSKYERFTNKPAYNPADVPGSTSRQLIKPLNAIDYNRRPDNALHIDDIDGTRYTIKNRMLNTKRHVNPLAPEYALPKYEMASPFEPKFVRNQMDSTDIFGTTARSLYNQKSEREILNINDIVGAKASYRDKVKQMLHDNPPRNIMETSDVSSYKSSIHFRTSRSTSNLDPIYIMNGMVIADDDRYSKPKKPVPEIKDSHLLRTDDVPGATTGWKDPDLKELREIKNITSVADISGAQADTLKRTLHTNRQTNPLQPIYQSLDDGDPIEPLVKPLIPSYIINKPTLSGFRMGESSSLQSSKSEAVFQSINGNNKEDIGNNAITSLNSSGIPPLDMSGFKSTGRSNTSSSRPSKVYDLSPMQLSGRVSNQSLSSGLNSSRSSGSLSYRSTSAAALHSNHSTSAINQRFTGTPNVLMNRSSSVNTISIGKKNETRQPRLSIAERAAVEALKADIESVRNLY